MSECNHTWKQTETTGTTCVHCGAKYQRPLNDWELIAELAVVKRERDDFKDSMEYWELQYRGKGADLTALREAAREYQRTVNTWRVIGFGNTGKNAFFSASDKLAALLQGEGDAQT